MNKKDAASDVALSKYSDFARDSDLEPRDLMKKMTEEFTKRVLQNFAEREKVSN
jgi:hypothetical protein